ncbi:FAR1 DNA binding domain-containing protein [Cynara cardunculus var. scolymus]|uniref:FAR1 DNA binding domain-containing protein n=1 Tax=Cynara cardunculus var. scolymus TaxID=59895 RepID=A0A118JS43_CYNCS|nr:FAR1 DNA binding domain-containing protein [Cynara cardunculus var. scolymus]
MEVCLNCEPVFEEDELVDEKAHDDEVCETQSNTEPPATHRREHGFGIRVSNSWFRSKVKERYRVKLSCSSAGFKKKSGSSNTGPKTRRGCPAMIIIKLVDSKRWRIIEVELLHNHPVSPEVKRFYKSHKRMILASKKGYQLEHVEEIHTIKLYHTNITAVNHAGYSHDSNLDGKEVRFFLKSSKHLDLKVPEKLGGLKDYEAIKRQIHKAVYDSLKLILKLHDRQQWVPVYLNDVAFAGMIPLKEFLDKYDLALHRNRLKEAKEDLKSRKASIFTP